MKIFIISIAVIISLEISRNIGWKEKYYKGSSQLQSYLFIFHQDGKGEIYSWGGSFRSNTVFDWIEFDKGLVIYHKFSHDDENYFTSDTLAIKDRLIWSTGIQDESDSLSKFIILPHNLRLKQISQKKFKSRFSEFVEKGF